MKNATDKKNFSNGLIELTISLGEGGMNDTFSRVHPAGTIQFWLL